MVIFIAVSVFGCRKKAEPKPAEPKPEEEPEKQEQVVDEYAETVEEFLEALKNEDAKSLKELYEGSISFEKIVTEFTDSDIADTVDISDDMVDSLKGKLVDFDYSVGKSEKGDREVIVPVKITAYDLEDSIESWWGDDSVFGSDELSEDEYIEKASRLLADKIESAEKDNTEDVKITLIEKDGEWIVADLDENESFIDAISGGLLSAIDDIQSEMGEIEA